MLQARTKKVLRWAATLFIVTSGLFIWEGYRETHPRPDITKEIFGTKEVRHLFATAGSATVQRLHLRASSKNPGELENYDHGPIAPVPPATVRRLQELFQKPDSFSWDIVKSCAPDYGVLYTFHTPPRKVKIALCFKCGVFAVYNGSASVNSEEDFEAITQQLVDLTEPLFRDDAGIQNF